MVRQKWVRARYCACLNSGFYITLLRRRGGQVVAYRSSFTIKFLVRAARYCRRGSCCVSVVSRRCFCRGKRRRQCSPFPFDNISGPVGGQAPPLRACPPQSTRDDDEAGTRLYPRSLSLPVLRRSSACERSYARSHTSPRTGRRKHAGKSCHGVREVQPAERQPHSRAGEDAAAHFTKTVATGA